MLFSFYCKSFIKRIKKPRVCSGPVVGGLGLAPLMVSAWAQKKPRDLEFARGRFSNFR